MVYAVFALLGLATTALAVSTPIPPGGVPIESSLAVANATQKTPYKSQVNAKPDEVVNVQVWYHNPAHEDSGRIAKNVNVKLTLPTSKSKNHTIGSRVAGSNTNIETHVAAVNTSVSSSLTYIPGSAVRRYNSGTNANPKWINQKISDSIVSTGYNVGNLKPCWNFQETITIQARVTVPALSIVKQVKTASSANYVTENTAKPGETLNYRIIFKNEGNTELRNVMIRDNMPPGVEYIKGSAKLYNALFPNGTSLSDAVTSGGANIGHYAAGASATVRIDAKVPTERPQVGKYIFNNIANVKADNTNEFYNSVKTNVTYEGKVTDTVNIIVVKFHDLNENGEIDSNEPYLKGWQFEVTGPNNYSKNITTDETGRYTLTDLEPGRYTVTEILKSGWKNTTGISIERTVTTDESSQKFVFGNKQLDDKITPPTPEPPVKPEPPKEVISGKGHYLPETGPAEAAAMAFGTLGLSGSAVAWMRSKKRLLDSFRK